MKKISMIAAVIALTVISCAKDRTCTCTHSDSAGSPSTTTTVTLVKASKSQGKAACVSTSQSFTTGVTYKSDCKLS
jgi:hypothetical protein